jgi:hypothetical protein
MPTSPWSVATADDFLAKRSLEMTYSKKEDNLWVFAIKWQKNTFTATLRPDGRCTPA